MVSEIINETCNPQLALSYSELKRYYDILSKSNDQIDQKMMYMFSSIGIVLTLFGFSEIDSFIIHNLVQTLIFIVIGITLIVFLFCFFLTIIPQVQPYPIEASFETITEIFYEKESLEDVYYQINSNYIHFIKINEETNRKKSRLLRLSMISYSLILIFSLLLIFIY